LQDPVRPGVPGAVAECAAAGIRVIVITGDYPGTALAIAQEIGLDHTAGCVTGPELEEMSDAELARPDPLRERVRANGPGTEAPADPGAQGKPRGGGDDRRRRQRIARVARRRRRHRDGRPRHRCGQGGRRSGHHRRDFASIVGGVRQGRGIFDNLRKALAYIVAVHGPIFGISLLPVFVAGWPLVLLPVQIAFLELIIDPACSIVFESEQIDPEIMQRRPRRLEEPIIDRRLLTISGLQGLSVMVARLRRLPVGRARRPAR
jgi:P-type Ca2+ transporter type 2C